MNPPSRYFPWIPPKAELSYGSAIYQAELHGVKWFVEGDIKGCFDNVDHHVLVQILRRRIADEHFIGLIWKFLKAGYMVPRYHNTYSGTPQGSRFQGSIPSEYLP